MPSTQTALRAPDRPRPITPQDPAAEWSGELIASLDWLRVAELLRAMAAHAGCQLGGSRVFPDGSVLFAMVERPRSERPQRALVRLVPWNDWEASTHWVETFARELAAASDARGVLVAPGGFSAAARHAANIRRIETVDAAQLALAVRTLPPEKQRFFLSLIATGDPRAPSCPVCLKKLALVQKPLPVEMQPVQADMVFPESAIVAEPVVCSRLIVQAGCEVQFLHAVHAREIMVWGHATGDFVCEGALTLEPGAILTGTVAARAVNVRDGAELIGPARIIEGPLQAMVHTKPTWHWCCENREGKPQCKAVLFEMHE